MNHVLFDCKCSHREHLNKQLYNMLRGFCSRSHRESKREHLL